MTFIEIWNQDIDNKNLFERDQILYGSRNNHIITPTKSTNTTYKQINTQLIDVRDISIENKLLTLDVTNHRDIMTHNQRHLLDVYKHTSNHSIYRTYHSNEINSVCYPNIDKYPWDNITKAIYKTTDVRNKIFPVHLTDSK